MAKSKKNEAAQAAKKVEETLPAVVTPKTGAIAALPAHLQEDAGVGLEDMQQFIRPARVKVIQKTASDLLLEDFRVGDLVLMPNKVVVAEIAADERGRSKEEGAPFFFVPLFFYAEWLTVNPFQMRTSLPMIRDRTIDPNSQLRAKCNNQNLWYEACPENPEFKIRNVEALNFVCLILHNEQLENIPVILSFQRGEHRTGTMFLSSIKMRKAAIFGNVFQAHSQYRPDAGKGDWYGIEVENPSEESGVSPFVLEPEQYAKFKAMHAELKAAHEKGLILADYEDETEEAEVGDSKGEF